MATTYKWTKADYQAMVCGDKPHHDPEEDNQDEDFPTGFEEHVPFMNLTKEQRREKSDKFKFGLCCSCDTGLDDKSEFVCDPRPNGAFVLTCNACDDYNRQLFFMGCGQGCN
jgi:hypothetical protein